MADTPDRIRVAQDADGFWTCREAVSGSQEYVRADLYAALEAQLAEVRGAMKEADRLVVDHGGPYASPLLDVWRCVKAAISALEATPPAPKVTVAMVEAACRAYNEHQHGKGCPVWEDEHPPMRAALKAAMEAGR